MKIHKVDYTAGIRKRRTWYADTDEAAEQTDDTTGETSTASTETVNTDTEKSPYVSKDRFNVVNEKMKQGEIDLTAARAELETFKAAKTEAETDRLKKQGEFEELFNAEKVKATDLQTQLTAATDSLTALQTVFNAMLDKRKETLPDHIKPLLENMDALAAMDYLDKNAEQFTAPDTGSPRKQTAPPMHATDGGANKPGEQVGSLRARVRL